MLLERVGQTLTLLFHDFPRVACDEEVVSEAYPKTPSLVRHMSQPRTFRYIVVPRPGDHVPAFEEYRTDLKGNPLKATHPSGLFMITSGYVSTCLFLSPSDQDYGRFRHFGIQTLRERECHVVGFAQEAARVHRTGTIRFGDKEVVVLVQGLVWIDSKTFQILRIATWLLAPRTDIGLDSQTSTVDFYPVRPKGFERVLWLPREVMVVMDYRGTRYQNTHHYSNFKLFRVESTIKPAE
jgi:hypothetical protein